MKINTPTELRAACCLDLCYSDEQLAAHLPLTLTSLLAVPPSDALWCLAGLLSPSQRQEWAEACARRAKEYTADDDAAAYAARAAYAAWAAAAAEVAEQRLAIRHAALLLGLLE